MKRSDLSFVPQRLSFGLAATTLCWLMAGCSVSPQRPGEPPSAKPAPGVSDYPKTGPRGGAYYKDDGPGDAPPPGLESTPDAMPKVEPLSTTGNRPYNVFGKAYVPMQEDKPLKQKGIASWYGRKFHGQRTSSGEPYDMYAMTAAHPTMPLPSYAKVTNLKNGKSVVVRVNDRGPFHSGRVMDLSYTAALKLGYVAQGSTEVELERLTADDIARYQNSGTTTVAAVAPAASAKPADLKSKPTSDQDPIEGLAQGLPVSMETSVAALPVQASDAPKPAEAGPGKSAEAPGVFLQLGAFGNAQAAEQLQARLSKEVSWLKHASSVLTLDRWFKVQLGPFEDRSEAAKIAARLQQALQIDPVIVMR